MFGVQRLILRHARDLPLDVVSTMGTQLVPWLVWAFLVPWIAADCLRHPANGQRPVRVVARSAAMGVIVALTHTALCVIPLGLVTGWQVVNLPLTTGFAQLLVNRGVAAWIEYVLIVAVLQVMLLVSHARMRDLQAGALQAQVVDAELRALRTQLEPHFLFNTLNGIHAHIQDAPELAEEMLRHLSDVLRSVLDGNRTPERPLGEELALVRSFLRIHEFRFGTRLAIDVHSERDCETALTPTLLLQPLVENAIAHGVSQRPGSARIAVSARRDDARLVVAVEDSGDHPATSLGSGHGIGLSNLRQRLAHHYGDQFAVTLDRTPTRTTVTLSLPFVEGIRA
jgi:two-component system, LytTR family, sensor kinase